VTPTKVIGVRLSNEKLAEIDGQRGDRTRAQFVKEAIDSALLPSPTSTSSGRVRSAKETRAAPVPKPTKTSSKVVCDHPVNRRIGGQCALCGEAVAGKR
jgi:hypothetical protein